jgi:hypothetical protein
VERPPVRESTSTSCPAAASSCAVDDPTAAPAARWPAVCRAVRGWAQAHPHEYALLYGSPVSGYRAPQDTVPAATRVGVVLGRVLGDAARAGLLPAADRPATGTVGAEAAAVLGGDHPAPDDTVRARALLAWSALFGAVSFELFGHFTGSVTDADAFFDEAMTDLASLLGL